jgi:hypothetical protein
MAGVDPTEIDQYERRLFDYYGLQAFAGPWQSTRRSGE